MGIQTFLGPILQGTQKNNAPNIVTSNTPSASFLASGPSGSNFGGYRNTGVGDNFQFISIPAATLTGIAAASFPYTFTPVYTNQGVNYPLVFPAGAYIDNIDLIINTAVSFNGAPTGFVMEVQLIGAPGTTYATAQTIATAGTAASTSILGTAGVYSTGNTGTTIAATNPIVYSGSTTPINMIQNVGTSDAMLQLKMTFTGGTTPTIAGGAFALAINYVVRNPDGSWYPQTPPSTTSNPTSATY